MILGIAAAVALNFGLSGIGASAGAAVSAGVAGAAGAGGGT